MGVVWTWAAREERVPRAWGVVGGRSRGVEGTGGFWLEPGRCCPLGRRRGRDRLVAREGIGQGLTWFVCKCPLGLEVRRRGWNPGRG